MVCFTSLTKLTYLAEPLYWLTRERRSLGTFAQLVGISPEATAQFVLAWPPPLLNFQMAAQGQLTSPDATKVSATHLGGYLKPFVITGWDKGIQTVEESSPFFLFTNCSFSQSLIN